MDTSSSDRTASADPPDLPGLPLRAWLVSANALILLVVVLVSGVVAWRNGDRAVDDLALQLQRRAAAQVGEHLRSYLAGPHKVIQLMADAMQFGELSLQDPAEIYRQLRRLAELFPQVSYLNIATRDGDFYGLGRIDNTSRELRIEEAHPPQLDRLLQYALGPGGKRGELLRTLPFSDPRQQVWYRQPREQGRAVWSEIYNWVDNPEIMVASAGMPINAPVEGVVGVDMFLANIGEFLAGMDISPGARAFIIERSGLVVASSLRQLPFRREDTGVRRLRASELDDAPLRRAFARLQEIPGGLIAIQHPVHLEFGIAEVWYLSVVPWRDAQGLDWLIVVTVPEEDFDRTVVANTLQAFAVTSFLLLAGVVACWVIGGYLVRPLRRLERAARLVAGGDREVRVGTGAFREFNRLASTFNTMTAHLRDAFQRLEGAQDELEDEVRRRTEELRRANVELERLAREDALTGLANRRCFDARLREEWLRARRGGEPLGLVICDIDHFKAFNDRYGHSAGDQALREVATALAAGMRRASDLAARYGGEEFVLLLPGTDAQDAGEVAGALRERILELAISHEDSPLGCISVSFGVACHEAGRGYAAPEQFVKAADRALYAAKARGRNRVEFAELVS